MKNHLLVLSGVLATALAFVSAAQAQSPTSTLVRVSSFEYDANGLLIREVVEPDRPNDCLQTSYVHDAYGNRTSASSAACAGASGHTLSSATTARASTSTYAAQTVVIGGTSYSSPAGAFATSTSNALGQSETRTYDPRHGGVTQLVGPNGGMTTWTYDAFGRKTRENRADGTYSVWAYTLCQISGQPRDALCPTVVGSHALIWYVSEASHDSTGTLLAPIKYQFHDALDRAVRVQTQDFHGQVVVQDTHYNALGQVSQKSILHRLSGGSPHWTNFTYDAIGRMLSETSPDGNGGTAVAQIAYNGLVTTVTNPQGQTQTTHKNASGQTAKVVDHLGSEVLYTYDALGQLSQTNAAGSITQISYNRRGQKQSMQDPAMGAWDYAYNAFGELVWQQDSLSQTSTMAYDVLGRMTQRTEPDLVSHWYHDRRADGTACGAGIGKLCEATADNGYRRVHAYDAIGRPTSTATALDSPTNLATVSQTFHPQTGRLASKTWPTGYRATYSYSASGFLSKVEGGGVAGHTQVVSLEVLAMDPQGRITQYKQDNHVTTVKAYDQPTGKLNGVQATLQGQGAGNVLNHSYGYDKLGNLLTRTDANTGVTENYQYDGLSRLSRYTIMGGGVSSAQSVQTLYDRAGNLKYKSDVGYYHYDPVRPNRLNHVTLAPEAGWNAMGAVTQANTGTRALSYAYDDSRAGARSIQASGASVPMGNGNLWYAVSQDQANGRHTVRWETYTSFNMPKEILLGNLGTPNTTPAVLTGHSCPAGYTLDGINCTRTVVTPTSTAATPQYNCPAGYALSGTTCTKVNTTSGTAYCAVAVSTHNVAQNRCERGPTFREVACPIFAAEYGATYIGFAATDYWEGEAVGTCHFAVTRICPSGYAVSGATCAQTVAQAATLSYGCPAGTTLNGTTCQGTTTTVESQPASPIYSCPAGTALSGTTCSNPTAAVADRTLSFIYGPEHQRIRQTVAFTSNAPSHMEAGTTWYLNGEDSQGLSYEKEIKANGITEHKHYVNAGGMSFALYVKREGALNGQPATSISYLHHDHLGSIAVISNEAGAVTERLAYDPWGKRRNVNGTPDPLDALYGVHTDRGYTMHEHLDEMGIIHMNGRIYDPLIGRFMSADPFIQSPGNLQSHNRYAYVLNNPLAYTDPSGYFSLKKHLKSALKFAVAPTAKNAFNFVASQPGQAQIDRFIMNNQWANSIGQAAASFFTIPFCGGCGGAIWASYYTYQGTGSMSAAARAGGIAYGTAAAFTLAGTIGEAGSAGRYLAHAGAGCISAVAGGGKCGAGASSALFGKFTTNQITGWGGGSDSMGWVVARGVATAVAGGVGSVIGGGKFANGAETAAYGYLFNQLSQRRGCMAGNYMTCAMGDRESDEWKAADQKIKAGAAAVVDATDKGAAGAAMACVAIGNAPCAGAATGVSVVAKGVSYALSPPGPRAFFLDTASMISGPAIDRIATMTPLTWFTLQTSVTLGAELMKPHMKAADEAARK